MGGGSVTSGRLAADAVAAISAGRCGHALGLPHFLLGWTLAGIFAKASANANSGPATRSIVVSF